MCSEATCHLADSSRSETSIGDDGQTAWILDLGSRTLNLDLRLTLFKHFGHFTPLLWVIEIIPVAEENGSTIADINVGTFLRFETMSPWSVSVEMQGCYCVEKLDCPCGRPSAVCARVADSFGLNY